MSSSATNHKVFIFSFSMRSSNGAEDVCISIRPIVGLLGCAITKVRDETHIIMKDSRNWLHEINIYKTARRIRELICYKYNSGGGPMITCYIDYV